MSIDDIDDDTYNRVALDMLLQLMRTADHLDVDPRPQVKVSPYGVLTSVMSEAGFEVGAMGADGTDIDWFVETPRGRLEVPA